MRIKRFDWKKNLIGRRLDDLFWIREWLTYERGVKKIYSFRRALREKEKSYYLTSFPLDVAFDVMIRHSCWMTVSEALIFLKDGPLCPWSKADLNLVRHRRVNDVQYRGGDAHGDVPSSILADQQIVLYR